MVTVPVSRRSSVDQEPKVEIRHWLEDFAAAVRNRDFAAGRALFAEHVFAFGTRADRIEGLADLEADQWRPIWNSTRAYHFDHDAATIDVSGEMAWVAITWHSQGKDAAGTWYDRFGRATYILRRVQGAWVAVHSHHSINPGRGSK
jgi:ketosteroid isomerase-like protein